MLWVGFVDTTILSPAEYIRIRLDNLELQDAESEVSMLCLAEMVAMYIDRTCLRNYIMN